VNRPKIRIIVIDDHRRVHQALAAKIDFMEDIDVLAHGSNGIEAIDLCAQHRPDVILMDVLMPGMDGIEATRQIHKRFPDVKILALSSFDDQDTVRQMLANGAAGYLLKESSLDELEHAIRAAAAGQTVLSPALVDGLLKPPTSPSDAPLASAAELSRREQEVLQLFAIGLTNAEIAAQLFISVSTVKFHMTNILEKLGATTRAEALVTAAKRNLI
jgi:two-component system, NarL family, response regulator LiaR